jgi:hypothetical protein
MGRAEDWVVFIVSHVQCACEDENGSYRPLSNNSQEWLQIPDCQGVQATRS